MTGTLRKARSSTQVQTRGYRGRSWAVCVMWNGPPAEAGVLGATLRHGSRV